MGITLIDVVCGQRPRNSLLFLFVGTNCVGKFGQVP